MSDNKTGIETLKVWQKAMDLAVKVYREINPYYLLKRNMLWLLNSGAQLKAFRQILLKVMGATTIKIICASAISPVGPWKKR